ncbi:hypothetical protein B0T26DRAFT_745831 [Lasiosphaeria miniovina]|uniref:Uncharacterized protein n=1 Tax=Lasiosphaeria miniovina TaxID=1954250 RepID=A0AA40BGK7_9PEZI|nr:uncharacterized protein B0T26DRAFT_745831 [Lasiosphaeria miniovina]KAK0733841.1 hypothetical protein B0T26DRAFT_745831 [Lasiosphaeria miniovina]
MKPLTIILAFAATALADGAAMANANAIATSNAADAATAETAVAALDDAAGQLHKYKGCKPATYACAKDPKTGRPGWQFAGDCPPKSYCKFNYQNGSPYCLPW